MPAAPALSTDSYFISDIGAEYRPQSAESAKGLVADAALRKFTNGRSPLERGNVQRLIHDNRKFDAVTHVSAPFAPNNGEGESRLSSPSTGRTFEHSSSGIQERDLAKQVAGALVVDFGHYKSTHKAIAQKAGTSPETVKRWLAGDNIPSFVYIMRLRPHSPALRKLLALESDLSPDFTKELSALIQRHIQK